MNDLPLDIPAWVPAVKGGTALFEARSKETGELVMFARSPYSPDITHESQVFINLVDGMKHDVSELVERYDQVRKFIPAVGTPQEASTAPYSTELLDRAEHNLSVAYLREKAGEEGNVMEARQAAEFAVHAEETMIESRKNRRL